MVLVESRRGKSVLPAVVTKTSMPGILFVPWHDQAFDRMINFVCNDAVDPGSKEPEFKIAAVRIQRVSGPVKIEDKVVITDINSAYS
jgi:nitrate reductase NapA